MESRARAKIRVRIGARFVVRVRIAGKVKLVRGLQVGLGLPH